LLVGATGLVAAAMSTVAAAADATGTAAATPPADPPKWLPYADIGGGIGSGFALGKVDLFAPVWQDLDSMLFASGGLEIAGQENEFWNLGLGYRTKVTPDWILGLYAGYDRSQDNIGHMVHQFSAGAEMMSEDWDFRVNGYLAPQTLFADGKYSLYIHDTAIAILEGQEAGYSGFDGEIGYRIFNTDSTDVRLFAGGFWFDHSDDARSVLPTRTFDFPYRDIAGPKARAEVNVFALDGLGAQSRLSFEGEVAHDSVRGTTGFLGATLRIALNDDSGAGAQALDELDRRMADPERRQDNVLTQITQTKAEPVIIYNGSIRSQPTNNLYYARQQAAAGAGTYANPTTLQDATKRGPVNQFIVVTNKGGPVVATGAVVQPGETVVGGGETFTVEGYYSHQKFTHDFAPGSGPPTFIAASPTANVITLDSNSTISGVTIGGAFGAAIYGHDASNVTLNDVTIDGAGGGKYGVQLKQDGGNVNLTISNTTISNVSVDAVNVTNTMSSGGTSTENITLDHATITGSGHDGVYVNSAVSGGSSLTVNTTLTSSTITGSGSSGVALSGTVAAGSSLTQNLVIDPTTISGGLYGVLVNGAANGGTLNQTIDISDVNFTGQTVAGVSVSATGTNGATVNQSVALTDVNVTETGALYGVLVNATGDNSSLTQSINLSGVNVSGTVIAGVAVYAYGENAATVNQSVDLSGVTVTGSYFPIAIGAGAESGAHVTQTFSLSNVSVSDAQIDGIDIEAYADGAGSVVHQYGTMDHVTANGTYGYYEYYAAKRSAAHFDGARDSDLKRRFSYGDGIHIYEEASYGGTAIQRVAMSNITAHGNYNDGIYAGVNAYSPATGGSTVAAQYISVTNSNLAGNFIGFEAEADSDGNATAKQNIYVGNTVLSDLADASVQFEGASVEAFAFDAGSVEQNAYFINDTAQGNYNGGLIVNADSGYTGFAEQTVQVEGSHGLYSQFTNNGGYGIAVSANAFAGGDIEQNVDVYYVDASHNGRGGLSVESRSYGIAAGTYLYYSHVSQNVVAAFDHFDNNGGDGVRVYNTVQYGAQLNQVIELYNSTASNNAGDGISVFSRDIGPSSSGYAPRTNLYSDVYVTGSTFDGNAQNGISVISDVTMPTDPSKVFGFSYLIQHVYVGGSHADGNTGDGFFDSASAEGIYSLNIQYITLAGSTFDHNGGDGAGFAVSQYFGPYSFGAAIQDVTITSSDFSYNHGNGLLATANAYGFQGRAEQHFTINASRFDDNGDDGMQFYRHAHDGAYYPGYPCTSVQGLVGGCAFVRQTVYIGGSDISFNGGDGIYIGSRVNNYGAVYSSSGHPAYTPTLEIVGSTVDGNTGDGLHLYNSITNNSYGYQYVLALDSHFDHNGGNGIAALNNVSGGSLLVQKIVLYGITTVASASDNGEDGIEIDTNTTGGGQSGNLLVVGYSAVDGNGGDGIAVSGSANDGGGTVPTGVAQYIHVLASDISGNTGYGINLRTAANGAYAVTYQYLGLVNSTVNNNARGVNAVAISYNKASVGQNLYFSGDTITGNHGDGVYAAAIASYQGFTEQTVDFGYKAGTTTNITGNGGDGIYTGARAFTGSDVEQNIFVYDVNASNNAGNGLYVGANANGYSFGASYIYYSHISQNLIAAFSTFDHNGANGVSVGSTTYYGGALNQFVQLYKVDASDNHGDGFYEISRDTSVRGNDFAFNTSSTVELYIVDSTLEHNAGDGIHLNSVAYGANYIPAFFGGYSYMIQHTQVSGTTASNNGGSGFVLNAVESGVYSLNAQYVTLAGSTFDNNTGSGAMLSSSASYGPGGFGDTFEQITIQGSDFSGNGVDGLDLFASASGRQGRAEQHVTISYSTFDNNQGDGININASAQNGVYIAGHPCTSVQGLGGGCAFVRQNVTITNSDISHNGYNGIQLTAYANNYGAVYGVSGRPHSPTLELYDDTVNYNGGRGMNVNNHVTNHSYLYQYIAAIDTTFDHNHSDGIYASSYVSGASTMLQRTLLYSYHSTASASYNNGNGFKATIEALGGSYARDVNIVEGANLNNDGSFGFDGAVAYADGASTGLQINAVYFNAINHNGDGVGLYSIGPGAQQISYIGGNSVAFNAFVGVYGEANFGAFQYVGVYTFGNSVHDNGTNYLFNSFGGSTQILN
jgi:hypothetical protein